MLVVNTPNCVKCGEALKPEEVSMPLKPKGSGKSFNICQKCIDEFGGSISANKWIMDVFVNHTRKPDE